MRAEERAWTRRQQELSTAYENAKGLASFEAGLKPKGLAPGAEQEYQLLQTLYKVPVELMNAEARAEHKAQIAFYERRLFGDAAPTRVAAAPGAGGPPPDGKPESPFFAKLREKFREDGGKTDPNVVADNIIRQKGLQSSDPAAKAIREQVLRIYEEEKPGLLRQAGDAIAAAFGAAVDAVSGYTPDPATRDYAVAAMNPGADPTEAMSAGQRYYDSMVETAKGDRTKGVIPEDKAPEKKAPSAADYQTGSSTADKSIAEAQASAPAPEPKPAPKPGDVGKTNPKATSAGEVTRGLLDMADQAVVEGGKAAWDALGTAGGVIQEQGAKAAVAASEGLKGVQGVVADFLRGYTGTSGKAVNAEQAKADAIKIVGELRRSIRESGPNSEPEIQAAVKALREIMQQLRISSPVAYRATKDIFEKQLNELLNYGK